MDMGYVLPKSNNGVGMKHLWGMKFFFIGWIVFGFVLPNCDQTKDLSLVPRLIILITFISFDYLEKFWKEKRNKEKVKE